MEDDKIKVLIADDHEVVRSGLVKMLSKYKTIQIIAEANNGKEVLDLIQKKNPDIILLDIQMPIMNGIDALAKIREIENPPFVIMLTAYEDSHHIDKAVEAGADGYLLKNISAPDLVESIKIVLDGERVYSKPIIDYINNKQHTNNRTIEQVIITKREQEILNLVAAGKKSSEIADILFISTRTVETHRYNVMQKLGVNNTAALVRYAVAAFN